VKPPMSRSRPRMRCSTREFMRTLAVEVCPQRVAV
jgi:hypothetical protein